MHLSLFLIKILGFTKSTFLSAGVYTSEHIVDIDPVTVIHIYCDVIEHQTVGHTLAPLLGDILDESESGASISKKYDKLQYHPVLKKNISDIQISLRNDHGNAIRFRKGKFIVTLHFRKQKLSQL